MAFKKFPAKDPDEVLDYSEHFSELLEAGIELDTLAVEVESAKLNGADIDVGGAEDVDPLVVSNEVLIEGETSGIDDIAVFWLTGGTLGATYTLKMTVSDSENVSPDRTFVRRATIKIAKK